MGLNWQTPTVVIEYIRNNLEKIGTVSFLMFMNLDIKIKKEEK